MKLRKTLATIMVFVFVIGMFTMPTSAMSKSGGKYVKVKKATYQKYKKAYNNQKKLKKKINNLELKLANKQMDYEDAMDQYEIALEENEKLSKSKTAITNLQSENTNLKNNNKKLNEENAKLKEELENQKSLNRWVWNNIYSMGITYDKKVWTIPAEFPEKYIIDGATYKVEFKPAPIEESETNEE